MPPPAPVPVLDDAEPDDGLMPDAEEPSPSVVGESVPPELPVAEEPVEELGA